MFTGTDISAVTFPDGSGVIASGSTTLMMRADEQGEWIIRMESGFEVERYNARYVAKILWKNPLL